MSAFLASYFSRLWSRILIETVACEGFETMLLTQTKPSVPSVHSGVEPRSIICTKSVAMRVGLTRTPLEDIGWAVTPLMRIVALPALKVS